jgi:hypothetical protein
MKEPRIWKDFTVCTFSDDDDDDDDVYLNKLQPKVLQNLFST